MLLQIIWRKFYRLTELLSQVRYRKLALSPFLRGRGIFFLLPCFVLGCNEPALFHRGFSGDGASIVFNQRSVSLPRQDRTAKNGEAAYQVEVGSFRVTAWEGENEITWNNPPAADFDGVLILRGQSDFPTSLLDGTLIYVGRSPPVLDRIDDPSRRYYYSALAFNRRHVYSNGVAAVTGRRGSGAPGCRFIAHAGGKINETSYTNSMDALRRNYERGFRCFELDANMTVDNHLVAVHDWENVFHRLFRGGSRSEVPTINEFKALKMDGGTEQTAFDHVLNWLAENPEILLIIDIKGGNRQALGYLDYLASLLNRPELLDRILPEVFSFESYMEARYYGYRNVIISLYAMDVSDRDLFRFLKHNKHVYAVAMPVETYNVNPTLIRILRGQGIRILVHTVNDGRQAHRILEDPTAGIYTDILTPDKTATAIRQ